MHDDQEQLTADDAGRLLQEIADQTAEQPADVADLPFALTAETADDAARVQPSLFDQDQDQD